MLNSEELERYARHIVLAEMGGAGQQKLKLARVLIVGAGGLGAPVLQYLAAVGIGRLGIVDDDVVSLSNLQRQIIHDTSKVGELKTTSASLAIKRLNPHVKVDEHSLRLLDDNATELIAQYDVIVDGTDNFASRRLMAEICEDLKKPLVSAAVGRYEGSITTLVPFQKDRHGSYFPRFGDIFPEGPNNGIIPSCEEAGIIGALTGMLGTMQAMEVIKLITGIGQPLIGRLLMVDGASMQFETITYKRPENKISS